MKYTVLGATGFIGERLVNKLKSEGHTVITPIRSENQHDYIEQLKGVDLGYLIYAIGLTADFREKPYETIDAHIGLLKDVLKHAQFDRMVYLSSARVYQKSLTTSESAYITIDVNDPSDLYNLSKLMGESLMLTTTKSSSVVRLSNVYGEDFGSNNFLNQVLREAASTKKVEFHSSPKSSKDFISVDDAVEKIIQVVTSGKERIYNIGSGINTSNQQLADELSKCNVSPIFHEKSKDWVFPPLDTSKLITEFGVVEKTLSEDFEDLFTAYKNI
jgi:nucleoside-diphosphate-sugar epimerase